MTGWARVSDREKYGVVISNFKSDKQEALFLQVGDSVHISERNEDWYRGYNMRNRTKKGIFPKTHVHIKDGVVVNRNYETVVPKESPVVLEITSVLREWGTIWKQLFVTGSSHFEKIRIMMNELINFRSQIMSGTLPVDELKEVKQQVTAAIDRGNLMLELDLVVRDEQGNVLDPDETSTIQLFRQHEEAVQRLLQVRRRDSRLSQPTIARFANNLFVSPKNFVCANAKSDCELLLSLYDATECKFFTESYWIKWEGIGQERETLKDYRALFTDLGNRDLSREKVILVCQVIRIGNMDWKETDKHEKKCKDKQNIRRPFGVAVMDITDIMAGKIESDEDKHHFLPFVYCGERDFLETVIKKVITAKEVNHKGQGLWTALKLLPGDFKQAREEHPHLVSISTCLVRKMGFPEVILPGDVRNDVYLTLLQGEFAKGSKTSDKNVEVTVSVRSHDGKVLPNVISLESSNEMSSMYRSVVYYHEDKPRWNETFQVAVPIEEFYNAHLRFDFKHRSSSEVKDKVEKPFALSYVKLMQANGTTLLDGNHELLVYKIEHKKSIDMLNYLVVPGTRQEAELSGNQYGSQVALSKNSSGLTYSSKDSFTISTTVCSTKLTHNIDLLGLLKWRANPDNLKNNLQSLTNVDGEEIVKFLQDTLDALFNILMHNSDSDIYDNLVFDALVFVISLISDRKYQHFKPVLNTYITENFSATLAYNKLMVVLKDYVQNVPERQNLDMLLKVMKSLEFIFKFVVRSRVLFAALNNGKGQGPFQAMLSSLFSTISAMMMYTQDSMLTVQGAAMKYLPSVIPDVLTVFSAEDLSRLLVELINNVPQERLKRQKMMCVNDIVHSSLFAIPECRAILLPMISSQLHHLLEVKDELETCVKILGDIMELTYAKDIGPTLEDTSFLMLRLLRSVIQTVIRLDRTNPLTASFVAVLVSLLRQMDEYHYNQYITHFRTTTDLLDFLMEILLVFRDLVSKNVYAGDWNEMILLQNSVILKALRHFSHTIRDVFSNPFEEQLWNNFFHCAISFLTQDSLQLENFSQNKRHKIISKYKDMRRETGFEIRSMWFNLGANKIRFVPDMVGPILEMTLIPEMELRKATIPIFFDMMQCEFYNEIEGATKTFKYNFSEFEHEMITQLDALIEGGRGDHQYRELFEATMYELCAQHSVMREQGTRFVGVVARLLQRLLEYRTMIHDEKKENKMSCTVRLLEFYDEIEREELYIRYLHKLSDLHLDCENYTEAAFTLQQHANRLKWTDDKLEKALQHDHYKHATTHWNLKDRLYYDIIEYYTKGKMWENAITCCKSLVAHHENVTFNYQEIAKYMRTMAELYENILTKIRPEPEYFRVGYYGSGFPSFLKNRIFIYRGKEYERLSDFISRIQNQFPSAQLMNRLAPPEEEILNSPAQYLQINHVDPIYVEKATFAGKRIDDQILRYYKVNEVQKFTYSRPFKKGDSDEKNEFANLWTEKTVLVTAYPYPGILQWFPVVETERHEVTPLENAIETMENTNTKLRQMVKQHQQDMTLPVNPISMMLNGIVDAAVMGGIRNYEDAFFTAEYLEKHPDDGDKVHKLKDLIAAQIPYLEAGIEVHESKITENMMPLHLKMETCFDELRNHIEPKYGKKPRLGKFRHYKTLPTRMKKVAAGSQMSLENLTEAFANASNPDIAEVSLTAGKSPGTILGNTFVKGAPTKTPGKSPNKKAGTVSTPSKKTRESLASIVTQRRSSQAVSLAISQAVSLAMSQAVSLAMSPAMSPPAGAPTLHILCVERNFFVFCSSQDPGERSPSRVGRSHRGTTS
ncbi:PREDICTED: dedicator of cytokinesis protein 1-like [Priapulus caudatus]|uniref:Dedicator of cytokinesis protein 1-like n=1 Tax=Priapulus caudatus TaxID=37621 RepID=A0ABM1DNA4_PRICU|nr:PREDICTED: dedicator of cytokinesis protein 1-like [Priapulus caudatus]